MRDAEYLELPMKGSLELPPDVRTDGLDLKPSEDDVFGDIIFQHRHHVVNCFQKRGNL